jgi:hypothetical protein
VLRQQPRRVAGLPRHCAGRRALCGLIASP